jgi:hypothetical protein
VTLFTSGETFMLPYNSSSTTLDAICTAWPLLRAWGEGTWLADTTCGALPVLPFAVLPSSLDDHNGPAQSLLLSHHEGNDGL